MIARLRHSLLSMSRPRKRAILLAVDLTLVPVAYVFTLAVQLPTGDIPGALASAALQLPLLLVLTAAISTVLGVPNIRLNAYDVPGLARIGLLALLVSVSNAILHMASSAELSTGGFVVFFIVYFLFSATSRVVMLELLLALYRRHNPRRRVLIYGAGTTGMQLARALTTHDSIEAVAFVDDNPALLGVSVSGLPVLRPVDIVRIVEERHVDRVLLAMPSLSPPKLTQIARRLEKAGLEVQALPSFAQLIGEEELIDKMVPIPPARLLGRASHSGSMQSGCSNVSGRSVLVSGGGGSIGLELCRQILTCKPSRLVILDISELALYEAEKALLPLAEESGASVVPVLGSAGDRRLATRLIEDNDVRVVFHAAAYKHVPMVEQNPLVGMANNVLGTWTLARAARDAGVERFILISSDKAVRPTNIMGASKRLAEIVVQDLARVSNNTIFAMVRFGNVLGSSGSVVPLFQEQIARGGPVTLTHPDVTRYFMTPEEAVSLVLVAGSFATGGEVFVLDMGKPKRIADLARQVIHGAGYTVRGDDNPDGDIEIKIVGLRDGEKLHEELLIGEGHLTTAHEKIFAARDDSPSEIEVAQAIRSLREAVTSGDDSSARDLAVRFVDGYAPADAGNIAVDAG